MNDTIRTSSYNGSRKHHLAKLTPEQVQEIRRRLDRGDKQVDIARDFNVTDGLISRIYNRRIWTHLPEPDPEDLTAEEIAALDEPATIAVVGRDGESGGQLFKLAISGTLRDITRIIDAGMSAMVSRATNNKRVRIVANEIKAHPLPTAGH